jgi:hypothetical protein
MHIRKSLDPRYTIQSRSWKQTDQPHTGTLIEHEQSVALAGSVAGAKQIVCRRERKPVARTMNHEQ